MSAAASLMLAAVYLFIWIGDRRQRAHLAFSTLAVGIAAFAGFELAMMHASSSAHYATLSRWIQAPTWVMIVSIVWFTRAYLRAGRLWLGWTIVGLRTLALLVNFSQSGSITFREGAAIEQVLFFGERVFIPVAEPKPWMLLPHASVLLLLLFLVDASITVWRRGERRLAVIVGGSMVLFTLQGLLQVVLVLWGFIVVPMRISVGFLIMLLVMALEIRRQIRIGMHAARQLHDAEQQAKLTVGVAGIGFWSWDVQRGELWASALARVHLGVAGREAPGLQDVLDAAHDDDREAVRRAIDKARFDGGEQDVEYRISGPDGRTRWFAARVSAERSGTGGVVVRGVTMDVTQRKYGNEKFLLTIEASPSAVLLVDRGGRIVHANSRAEALFGYGPGELVDQGVEMLIPMPERAGHAAHRDRFFAAPAARAMGVGRELQGRRKDGTEFPVEVGLNPIVSEQGPLVLCSIVDISARRQTESEIAQLRESLSHVGRVSMMGQLASALAHEINQPLGAILRNAEAAELVLQQDPADLDELRAIVADIQRDDQRAGEVIDRIRSLLKRRDIDLRPLSAADLLRDAVAVIRSFADGLHVRIATEIMPDTLRVMGDRIHLQQVMLNLLVNAIHAVRDQTPDRRLVMVRAGLDDPQMARISVIDRGCGVHPDRLTTVFEPFFTTKSDGMGMGLAISRTIVEAHGGRISVEHTPGGGATFHCTLRAAD